MGREIRRALVTPVILAAVLLASVYVPGVVGGSQQTPGIDSATFESDGVLGGDGEVIALWNNGTYELGVNVSSGPGPYEFCVHGTDPDPNCRYVNLDNGTQTLTVTEFPWDANTTGRHTLNLTIGATGGSSLHDFHEREVRLLDPAGDPDDDGLDNRAEVAAGTNLSLQDTDRDGIDDGTEVHNYGTDPTTIDTDDDGLTDAREINGWTEPTDPDTDGDGLEDGPEVNEYGTDPTVPDSDDDGLDDGEEVDEYGTDPLDADTDDDGVPDGREVADPDADPTDPELPRDALADEDFGILPPWIGDPILVLAVLTLVGVVLATGFSWFRDGRPRVDLPWIDDAGESEDSAEPVEETGGGAVSDEESVADADRSPETQPAPILTDEEQVFRILHENGGQVKQQRIVAETDWSKSKVSRLLSGMAEEGAIRKITLGRENVIQLPDDETDAESEPGDRSRHDRS